MQAYFEPEQAFSISTPQPVFEILIAYKKKTCIHDFFEPVSNKASSSSLFNAAAIVHFNILIF